MKKPEEIVEWLKSHEWYEEFASNVNKHVKTPQLKTDILNGIEGSKTIITAFIWNMYPYKNIPGHEFWSNVCNEFYDWYYNS